MKILAIEFSSEQRSVAVVSGDSQAAEIIESGGRAAPALAMIESALRQTGMEREQIEGLVVGLGPGSYSGIRAAIALAQGWELGMAGRVRLAGVSSVDCLAREAQAAGLRGTIQVVVDAQRQEFYLAAYSVSDQEVSPLDSLRIVSRAELVEREQAGALLVGPRITTWFARGYPLHPRALTLARMLSAKTNFVPGEKLEPIYLRETNFVKAPPPRILKDGP